MRSLRRWLKWTWCGMLYGSGVIRLLRWRLRTNGAIMVLVLHRVLDEAGFRRTASRPGMLLRRETFERLAAYAARTLEVVDLARTRPGQQSQRLRCAITFDDGWEDNRTIAWPIARRYRIPLTIFVCPGLLGKSEPFWPERVASALKRSQPVVGDSQIDGFIESLKLCPAGRREEVLADLEGPLHNTRASDTPDRTLSWEDVLEMDAAGVRFGSHTYTHHLLTMVPETVVRDEVERSKNILGPLRGRACTWLAYPNGNHSAKTRELLAEAGYTLAFTTQRAPWTPASDPLTIPRINIAEDDVTNPLGCFSPSLFEYSTIWKAWRGALAASPK